MISLAIIQGKESASQGVVQLETTIQGSSLAEQMAACEPTHRDYVHTLNIIGACNRAIEANPLNALAFSDRALAWAFLGQDDRALQDSAQAVQLGAERRLVLQELKLVRRIAIDCAAWDNESRLGEKRPWQVGLASIIMSLFGRL